MYIVRKGVEMNDYKKVISKADFNKVWSESTTEDILNQFYYEHNDLRELLKENGNKEEVITKLINNWNELRQHIKDYLKEWENSDDEWVKGKCVMARDILYDMEEIKEGKNESK
jgi:glutaredoxin-related protein